jgi:hypothetical protein
MARLALDADLDTAVDTANSGCSQMSVPTPMNRIRTSVSLLLLLGSACATAPSVTTADLHCRNRFEAGSFIGLYSLRLGELPMPPDRNADVDLVYYFDADDCNRGALMGANDRVGCLFPLGRRDWDELAGVEPPTGNAGSIAAIMPLSREQEGMAFWLRTGEGEQVIFRIVEVQEASHADLVAGRYPTLRLVWRSPLSLEGG